MKNIKNLFKVKVFLSMWIMLSISGGTAWAVVKSINTIDSKDQIFEGGANINVVDDESGVHTINFSGTLGISNGGTGNNLFTDGSVLFYSGSSISEDNSNLFWDGENNRLGVGTNSPTADLDVGGDAVVSGTFTADKIVATGGSVVVSSLTDAPEPPMAGQIYYDSALGVFRGYNGTGWVNLSQPTPTTTVFDGLVSYWKFDENNGNAVDSFGSNTLTNNDSAPFVSAKINNGADFELDDSADHFYITDASQSGLDITGDMSISAWIKPESVPDSINTVYAIVAKFDNNASSTRAYWLLYQYDTNNGDYELIFQYNDGYPYYFSTHRLSSPISTNTFHHVVITADVSAKDVNIWLDGIEIPESRNSDGGATSIANTDTTFTVGASMETGSPGRFFDGIIDEVGIWNRILTASEVSNLYNNDNGLSY